MHRDANEPELGGGPGCRTPDRPPPDQTLNMARRHLDAGQRREIVASLREHGHSNPAIAKALGVDEKTVRNDLAGSDYSEPDRVVGKDGKSYPARKPTVVAAKNTREAGKAQTARLGSRASARSLCVRQRPLVPAASTRCHAVPLPIHCPMTARIGSYRRLSAAIRFDVRDRHIPCTGTGFIPIAGVLAVLVIGPVRTSGARGRWFESSRAREITGIRQ